MPLLRRSAGTTEVTDIGIAFAQAQAAATGSDDTSLPAVYRSHQLITDLPASLSLEQISGTGVADPITPPLLTQPNPTETYPTTMRKIMSSLVMRGNTYLWPTGRDLAGNIRSVYVLDPDEVTVAWDSQRLYPRYQWRGTPMVAGRDIFHISINHLPGRLRGLGPIEATRVMLNGAKAEQNMARRIFEDDATPGGLLKVPRSLSKDEADEIQTMWTEAHTGRKRPAVLSGGVEFQQITISPLDAQFIEQRQFSVQEIARIFGIPGYLLLVDSGSSLTYSTTEALFRLFLVSTLNPTYLEPIEHVFSQMLPGNARARFRTDEILRADTTARYQAYEIGLRAGFLTVDEIRDLERLPPLDPTRTPEVPSDAHQ